MAWKADEQNKYNPFARTRSNTSYRGRDLENPPLQNPTYNQENHSETCLEPEMEVNRNNTANQENEFGHPKHANTSPVSPKHPNPVLEHPREATTFGTEDKSKDSTGSSTLANSAISGSETRRRHKWNPFSKKETIKEDDDLERKDSSDSKKSKKTNKITVGSMLKAVLFDSYINILLLAVPAGFAINYAHGPVGAVFTVNFIAIIPLAAMLSYSTEEIALRVGEVLGGLLNASFG
jgi:Ca2+:H+ antiporter